MFRFPSWFRGANALPPASPRPAPVDPVEDLEAAVQTMQAQEASRDIEIHAGHVCWRFRRGWFKATEAQKEMLAERFAAAIRRERIRLGRKIFRETATARLKAIRTMHDRLMQTAGPAYTPKDLI